MRIQGSSSPLKYQTNIKQNTHTQKKNRMEKRGKKTKKDTRKRTKKKSTKEFRNTVF